MVLVHVRKRLRGRHPGGGPLAGGRPQCRGGWFRYRYGYCYGGFGGFAHYDRWTGGYYHGGLAGCNPYTGRYGVSRSYYNPYTGRYGIVQGFYNPYTNGYAYHYGY